MTGKPRFERFVKVAKLVLCIPHSNADAERVFSSIGLNKTDVRNSFSLEGTLSSIMSIKMAPGKPWSKYEPPFEVIKAARSATSTYNKKHKED